MLLLTQLEYTRSFISSGGSSGCQKWQRLSELHPSISDSSCSSKIRSTISIKGVFQDNKSSIPIHMSLYPPLGLQPDQLLELSCHITYTLKPSPTSDISHHVHHRTACEFTFYILCTEQSLPALLHHRATFQSLQSFSHHCYQPLF